MHGAGSPQAQRTQIGRAMQLAYKKRLAKIIAGVEVEGDKSLIVEVVVSYFERFFAV